MYLNARPTLRGTRLLDVGREQVATHSQLVAAGVPLSTVTYRIRPGGRWQRLVPGVVLMHSGTPTFRERALGALAYAGPGAVLTGMAALRLYGLRTATPDTVQVLVPHDRRKQNHRFVIVERTRRLPGAEPAGQTRGLPCVSLVRAVVDASRRLEDLGDLRNLVSDAVQNHGAQVPDLHREMRAAARQRTGLGRRVLAEIDTGVRFAAEAHARQLIRRNGLPEPLYNVELTDPEGQVIAVPDGYYPEWVCGYQVDSRRWHLSPADYEATTRNRGYAGRFGIILVAVTPARIFEDPNGFLEDLLGAIATAKQRTRPTILHRTRTAA